MNDWAAPPAKIPPQPPAPRAAPAVSGRDRKFLPAALEILETPPPPLPIALISIICAFALAALTWSFFGRLDVHATAPGKIETAGYSNVIEPLDPGKIAGIHVETGEAVKAGDLLLKLDPAEAGADPASARDALEWLPEPFQLRKEAVLRADLTQLADALKALDKQMAQKLATRKRLGMSTAFQNTLMETLNQRVSTRQQAIDLNVGAKINLYDAKEELEKSEASLASDQRQLIVNDAALEEIESEKVKTVSQFIADNENKFADASRKTDEARQALAKASSRLARTKLYAPIDGVVQQMAVTTVGQVVTTGQQLVVVTPHAGRLQVEALVANLDIGFVKLGQKAAIKVDAFPFTRFGVLNGKVVEIASARFRNRKLSERSPMQPLPPVRRRRRRPLLGNPKASSFPSRSHWMRPR